MFEIQEHTYSFHVVERKIMVDRKFLQGIFEAFDETKKLNQNLQKSWWKKFQPVETIQVIQRQVSIVAVVCVQRNLGDARSILYQHIGSYLGD